jgi:DNA-binding XRE family transcriptional regulator
LIKQTNIDLLLLMFDNTNIMKATTRLGLPAASSLAELGLLFRSERKAQGLTQSQVAERVSCQRQTIADLEVGRNVTTQVLFKALGALGKQVQVISLGIDLENVRTFLGPDWED